MLQRYRTNQAVESTPVNTIDIRFGAVWLEKVVKLGPGEQIRVGNDWMWGKVGLGAGFVHEILLGSDSAIVIFDDQYSVTHFYDTSQTSTNKHLLMTSLRNLANIKSYAGQVDWEKRYTAGHSYRYRFVEQDYLDAQ